MFQVLNWQWTFLYLPQCNLHSHIYLIMPWQCLLIHWPTFYSNFQKDNWAVNFEIQLFRHRYLFKFWNVTLINGIMHMFFTGKTINIIALYMSQSKCLAINRIRWGPGGRGRLNLVIKSRVSLDNSHVETSLIALIKSGWCWRISSCRINLCWNNCLNISDLKQKSPGSFLMHQGQVGAGKNPQLL